MACGAVGQHRCYRWSYNEHKPSVHTNSYKSVIAEAKVNSSATSPDHTYS